VSVSYYFFIFFFNIPCLTSSSSRPLQPLDFVRPN
jgi:hypothetical protein